MLNGTTGHERYGTAVAARVAGAAHPRADWAPQHHGAAVSASKPGFVADRNRIRLGMTTDQRPKEAPR